MNIFKRQSVVYTLALISAVFAHSAMAFGNGSRMFNAIDTNQNGLIEQAEIVEMRNALFQRIDEDASGYLEASEIEESQSSRRRDRMEGFIDLKKIDTDHDGKISRQEFISAPSLLTWADSDASGDISREELRKFIEQNRK